MDEIGGIQIQWHIEMGREAPNLTQHTFGAITVTLVDAPEVISVVVQSCDKEML